MEGMEGGIADMDKVGDVGQLRGKTPSDVAKLWVACTVGLNVGQLNNPHVIPVAT